MYEIQFAEDVEGELKRIKKYYQNEILDDIDEQLLHQPTTETKRRKPMFDLSLPFEVENPPVWQLSVGDYRVFYDVDNTEKKVKVLAVRKKPKDQTTKEMLSDEND